MVSEALKLARLFTVGLDFDIAIIHVTIIKSVCRDLDVLESVQRKFVSCQLSSVIRSEGIRFGNPELKHFITISFRFSYTWYYSRYKFTNRITITITV